MIDRVLTLLEKVKEEETLRQISWFIERKLIGR